jgi:ankyrin repeat protein
MLKAVEDAIADPDKGEEFRFLLRVLQDLKAKKQVGINTQNEQGVNDNSLTGSTPLHYATRMGHLGIIEALVRRGADLNGEDYSQNTPLIEAANGGHIDVVKFLLKQPGINVNAADMGGETALYIAAEKGYLEIVMLLVGCSDIDINKAYNDSGIPRTARNIAQHMHDGAADPLKKAAYQQIVEELERRGCSP